MERSGPIEFRGGPDGRIEGAALVYGDVASVDGQPERFAPGAFQDPPEEMPVNLQHDADILVGTATLAATPTELRATLPVRAGFRDLVKRGALSGFSIEFRAIQESVADGVRIIERAALLGLALVDTGAYPQSRVEARKAGKPPRKRRQVHF